MTEIGFYKLYMKNIFGWGIGLLVLYFVLSALGNIGKYDGESAEYWFNAYDEENARAEELQTQIEDYQYALEEANDNIVTANRKIREAKYASDFDELRDALQNLEIIDTVSEP